MAETTPISYATSTWTGIRGCTKIATGCTNCFAAALGHWQPKIYGQWGPDGTRVLASPAYWRQPLAWDQSAYVDVAIRSVGDPPPARPRVLWDLGDLFENWEGPIHDHRGSRLWTPRAGGGLYIAEIPQLDVREVRPLTFADVRRDVFALFDQCQNLDFLVPTKRIQNARPMCQTAAESIAGDNWPSLFPWPNIWLGYSASDQRSLEAGLPYLLACRDLVPILWLSLEPLLGPIDLGAALRAAQNAGATKESRPGTKLLDWIVAGGESGPHARPMKLEWLRSIAAQCGKADIPLFVKQWWGRLPGQQGEIPDDLWSLKQLPRRSS